MPAGSRSPVRCRLVLHWAVEAHCLGVVGEGEAAHGEGHQPGGEHVLPPLGEHLAVEEEGQATVMMAGARQ